MGDVRIPRTVLIMWAMVLHTVVYMLMRGRSTDAVIELTQLHGLITREICKGETQCPNP